MEIVKVLKSVNIKYFFDNSLSLLHFAILAKKVLTRTVKKVTQGKQDNLPAFASISDVGVVSLQTTNFCWSLYIYMQAFVPYTCILVNFLV